MTGDMSGVIVPKSDQWNADDFLSGPMTFTIASVNVKGGKEQPVEISLKGTNKFYRPCKGMCRAMVAAWGADSAKYVGRSFTLYCDSKVKWAGMEVGGIRISHMSNIDDAMTMAITVSKGNKKPYIVKPLVAEASYADQIRAAATVDELVAVWSAIPRSEHKNYLAAKDARKAELTATPEAPAAAEATDGGEL